MPSYPAVDVDALLVACDELELEGAVLSLADRHVAHRDPRGARQSVTYRLIHDALDHVGAVCSAVNMLLRYRSVDFEPITILGNWEELFRPGLFPSDISAFAWPDPAGFS